MSDLEKYEKVNKCNSVDELSECIIAFSDKNGFIQGRERKFNAEEMVRGLELYVRGYAHPNALTREFGIRQQAMYIKFYWHDS